MVRLVAWVRFPQRALGHGTSDRPWRRSSGGQSTRLIIVLSSVRVRPPLPGMFATTETEWMDGQAEVRAVEAPFEHWDDGSYRPWEDDVDCGHHQDVGGALSGCELVHGVRSDRQGAGGEGAWDHDLDCACGVPDGEPSLRPCRYAGSCRLHQ